MRRFAFFVLLITIAALPAYSEEVVTGIQNGSRSFDMQLTKIGNSVFDFCTYESASASQPVALSNGIAFDFIETDSKQTTAKFGIYWDLFTQEKTTIGISVTFSATEDGATDYMLINQDSRGNVLNYSVSGEAFERDQPDTGIAITGITVPQDSRDSTSYTDRVVQVYRTSADAFNHIGGYAQLTATLDAPVSDKGQPMEFMGGEYNGFAILTVTVGE